MEKLLRAGLGLEFRGEPAIGARASGLKCMLGRWKVTRRSWPTGHATRRVLAPCAAWRHGRTRSPRPNTHALGTLGQQFGQWTLSAQPQRACRAGCAPLRCRDKLACLPITPPSTPPLPAAVPRAFATAAAAGCTRRGITAWQGGPRGTCQAALPASCSRSLP